MTASRTRSPLAKVYVCFGALVLASGCGPGTTEPPGDAAAARLTLSKALEAWKAGRKIEDLKSEDPVLYANDEDWQAGRKLTDYKILDEPVRHGGEWRVYAIITVSGAGGSGKPRKACYSVAPGSPSAVSRSDTLY